MKFTNKSKVYNLLVGIALSLVPFSLKAQVLNLGHAGKIENGFGSRPPLLKSPNDVFVQGNIAYVSSLTGNALVIMDVTLPAAPTQIASVVDGQGGALLNQPQKVIVSGHYAFLATLSVGGSLEIIDVADPSHPVHKGSLSNGQGGALLNNPVNLFVSGNYVYVINLNGLGLGSLEIVDVSDPTNPKHTGMLIDGGGSTAPYLAGASSICVSGNYAYIGVSSVGYSLTHVGLETVDISNPSLPIHTGFLPAGAPNIAPYLLEVLQIVASGHYLYAADFESGAMEVLDISNPAAPIHAGSLFDDGSDNPPFVNSTYSLAISGNYAYITSAARGGLVEVADISTPANPTHDYFLPNGQAGAILDFPVSIFISNNRAYIVNQSNSFEVLDVSNPALPYHLSSLVDGGGGAQIGTSRALAVANNYAYVVSEDINSFEILDVSVPSKPVHISSLTDGGGSPPFLSGARSVVVSGHYAYVVGYIGNYLEILDVTIAAAPLHVGYLSLGFSPSAIEISGTKAYIAGNGEFAVVDISNPSAPTLTGSTTGPGASRGLKIAGNYAYVVGGNQLEIIDISNAAAPSPFSSLPDGGGVAPFIYNTRSIFISGRYAYITSVNRQALEVVDIFNPALPVHVGSVVDGQGGASISAPETVIVRGSYAFVSMAGSGAGANQVEVFDLSDPTAPVYYASIKDGTNGALLKLPDGLALSGNYAFVTGLGGGMEVISLYSPKIASFSPATGSAGTQVTITGHNFNQTLSASFDGVPAGLAQSITESSAIVTVPPGATFGSISIEVSGLSTKSTTSFFVIPTPQAATSITQNSFTANWTDVGATTYYLDVSTDNFVTFLTGYNNLSVGKVTTYAVSGLTPGTSYQYRVRSSDGILTSGSSASVSAFLIADTPTSSAATAVSQTGFTANWSLAAGATGYAIDVAYDNAFSNFVVGYNNLTVANASATSQLVNGLNPYTTCYFRVRATSASGNSASSNTVAVVTLDIIPPVISPSGTPNPSSVTFGNTPIINAIIVDNVSIDTAQLFYRGISEKTFQKVNLQGPGGTGGSYSVTMQSTWYDTQGLEYYFRAVDEVGNTTVSTSSYVQLVTPSIALPALPSGTKQSDYRIVSFPYLLATDNKVTTVYSGVPWSDNTKAAMWWWNPSSQNSQGKYDQYGSPNSFQTVDPGKGYWVITNTSVTPQLANVPAPNYNRSKLYSMTLKPNWNEVGNPYPVAISWDDVMAFNQKNNVTSFSSLTIYDGTSYKTATGELLLKPFEGGFVKNVSSSDITIQIPFSGETSIGGRAEALGSDISQEAWTVFLHVSQEDFTNELGGFGMHPLAKPGPDRYDNFNPPQFMESPEVNFKNPDYPNALFSKDMVPSQGNYHWRFTPNGKHDVLMQLKWSEDLKTNASKPLFLLDEQTFEIIDMTQVNDYQFTFNKGSRFSIFYGVDIGQIALPEVAAGAPYPNPLSSEAAINLNLPDSGTTYQVALQIFNNKGELLGSTENTLLPGIQPLRFGMGDQVPSGMYLYKLNVRAENVAVSFTGKIIKL